MELLSSNIDAVLGIEFSLVTIQKLIVNAELHKLGKISDDAYEKYLLSLYEVLNKQADALSKYYVGIENQCAWLGDDK